jgi:hypothetical protein
VSIYGIIYRSCCLEKEVPVAIAGEAPPVARTIMTGKTGEIERTNSADASIEIKRIVEANP